MVAPENTKLEINPAAAFLRKRRLLNQRIYMQGWVQTHVGTYVNGKSVQLLAPHKRLRPAKCELCEVASDHLAYHHWDDQHPSHGIWVCPMCHIAVERTDKGMITKYLALRVIVDEEMSGLE